MVLPLRFLVEINQDDYDTFLLKTNINPHSTDYMEIIREISDCVVKDINYFNLTMQSVPNARNLQCTEHSGVDFYNLLKRATLDLGVSIFFTIQNLNIYSTDSEFPYFLQNVNGRLLLFYKSDGINNGI